MRISTTFRLARCNLWLTGTALALALACRAGTDPGQELRAAQLGLTVGPPAAAQSGIALSVQPVLQVQDAQGNAVAKPGVSIQAALATTGGTLSGALEVMSDASGRASFTNLAISGPAAGVRLRFDSPGLRSVTSGLIQLGAGIPVVLSAAAGNLQTAVAGSPVTIAPSVRVTDASGNPVFGVAVSFSASTGGVVDGASASTDAAGLAAPTRWTLASTIGLNTLTATSSAIPGASVSFTATGTVGPPAILSLVAGDGQSAALGGAVPIAPAVKLTDAAGHPLTAVSIFFAVGASGGALTGATPLTDAAGVATVGGWNLALLPGVSTVTASRPEVPTLTFQATAIGFPVQDIAGGTGHACAIDPQGKPFCWGVNAAGQLGTGGQVDVSVPTAVVGGLTFTTVSVGNGHSCGLVADGAAYCWGSNTSGQLGDGTQVSRVAPVAVAGGFKFAAIVTGSGFSCGVLLVGPTRCWGLGQSGQLGDATTVSKASPALVSGNHVFSALSAGTSHACGVEVGGALFCWGSNANGRLGDGTTSTRTVPTAVTGGLNYSAVAAGGAHTCAIAAGGAGYCWGTGASGRLGNGAVIDQLVPTAVSGALLFSAISAGAAYSCALTSAGGQAYCWGLNGFGQLGDGSVVTRQVPTAVAGGLSFSGLRSGAEVSCGRGTTGMAYCWGRNDTGAVGDGTVLLRNKPVGPVKP